MRLHRRAMGDLVNSAPFVAPQMNTFNSGMGDLVPNAADFVAPQMHTFNPSGMGCGCGGSCGGCGGGMGQLDLSLEGTGLSSELGLPDVPNWILYMAMVGAGVLIYQETRKKKGRR